MKNDVLIIKKIEFHKCKIKKHKGEWWEKLDRLGEDVDGLFRLVKIRYLWGADLSKKEICGDTFSDFTKDDFRDVLNAIYGTKRVFGMLLYFEGYGDTKGAFTTFRGYKPDKSVYYEDCFYRCKNGVLAFKILKTEKI